MNGNEQRTAGNARIWILPLLAAVGLAVAAWQPIGVATLLDWGRRVGTSPAFLAAVVVASAGLFTFGLPGSLGVWLIAPFNPPWLATVLLVAAGTGGALGAYRFAGLLGRRWQRSARTDKVVDVLRRRGDVFTLTALRMLPGFPHSAINFACGVLRFPLPGFVAATGIGLGVKWAVYAGAIHGIADAAAAGDAIQPGALLPLFALVVLGLVGSAVNRKLRARFRAR